MPSLDELRQQIATEEARLANEQAERQRLETRLAELRGSGGQGNENGAPFPPTNITSAAQIGRDADLSRWREMIHRDTFGEQVGVASSEVRRAVRAMFEDAVSRHKRNVARGRGDIGSGPASFYGGPDEW